MFSAFKQRPAIDWPKLDHWLGNEWSCDINRELFMSKIYPAIIDVAGDSKIVAVKASQSTFASWADCVVVFRLLLQKEDGTQMESVYNWNPSAGQEETRVSRIDVFMQAHGKAIEQAVVDGHVLTFELGDMSEDEINSLIAAIVYKYPVQTQVEEGKIEIAPLA